VALVVLIGMPGSGKTTVGAATAARLSVPFQDTDELVEAAEGRTVAEIFAAGGEGAFRAAELVALRRALSERAVVATGGGVVSTDAGRSELSGERCVYLAADLDLLVDRAASSPRPRLARDVRGTLERLGAARETRYRELASLRLDASLPVERLVDRIASFLEAGA
jgi:shikimate kinase